MNTTASRPADTAREQARRPDGRFGEQTHERAHVDLAGPVQSGHADDPRATVIDAALAMTDDNAHALRTRQMYGKVSESDRQRRRLAAYRAVDKVAAAKGLRDDLSHARGRALDATTGRWPGLIGAAAENAAMDAVTALTLRDRGPMPHGQGQVNVFGIGVVARGPHDVVAIGEAAWVSFWAAVQTPSFTAG